MTYFLWDKPTELDRPDNEDMGCRPTYLRTYVYSYGKNLSIPARVEDHSLRDAVER